MYSITESIIFVIRYGYNQLRITCSS